MKFDVLTNIDKRDKLDVSSILSFGVEMSHGERFGTLVWHAVCDLTSGDVDGYEVWASATSVGECAAVATATARKYLEALVEKGLIEKRSFMGMSGYRVIGGIDPRKGAYHE